MYVVIVTTDSSDPEAYGPFPTPALAEACVSKLHDEWNADPEGWMWGSEAVATVTRLQEVR